jgi:phosphoglycolate phosphatase-like HAD superfamily hydrolase
MSMADAVVDGGHVTAHKPDPESVRLTLSQLGIAADDTCMIGDSAVDIGAGINAGCAATIGITHGFGTENTLREAGATYVVSSLEKIQTFF